MKKCFVFLLVAILCLTYISPGLVFAATLKINKTKLTLDEGKSYSLKVTGTTKTVKWTTSNKDIATVSTKGVIKGISPGMAIITASVSSTKLTCKVTIREVFNTKKAIENIKVADFSRGKGIVAIIKNNYSFPMKLYATAVYYDSDDMMLGKSEAENYYFEKDKECVLFFSAPLDSDYNYVPYDHYKITYSASKISGVKSNLSDIEISSNIGVDNVMIEVSNTGEQSAEFTQIYILFYKDGEIVGLNYEYAEVPNYGDVKYLEFSFPYDENYDTVLIDDYKIYVNSSYYYE